MRATRSRVSDYLNASDKAAALEVAKDNAPAEVSGMGQDFTNNSIAETSGNVKHKPFKNYRAQEPQYKARATSNGFTAAEPSNETKKSGLVRMSDIEPQEVKMLWSPYIPLGKISLIRGDPGQGKTTLCITLAAIVSNGWAFPTDNGFTTIETGNVLFITAEDGLSDTIAPRLIAASANRERVFSDDGLSADQLSFVNPRFERLIQEAQPKLVIIDPIQAFLGANIDGHKANEVRPILSRVGALAEKYNCAVVMVEHLNKNAGGKGLYRGLGSIDITAAARSILVVGSNPENENEKGIAHIKHNLSKKGDVIGFTINDNARLEWDLNTSITADMIQGVGKFNTNKLDNALDEAKSFLNEALTAGKQESTDIKIMAKQVGITEATLRRARAELGVIITNNGGKGKDYKTFWELTHKLLANNVSIDEDCPFE